MVRIVGRRKGNGEGVSTFRDRVHVLRVHHGLEVLAAAVDDKKRGSQREPSRDESEPSSEERGRESGEPKASKGVEKVDGGGRIAKNTTHLRARVGNSLVHTQHHARRLGRTLQRIDLDQSRLPHKLLHVVGHSIILDVDSSPPLTASVEHAQLVEHVGSVNAGVVADLTGDDLERFGEGGDDELLLALDGARGVAEVLGDLHLREGRRARRVERKGRGGR